MADTGTVDNVSAILDKLANVAITVHNTEKALTDHTSAKDVKQATPPSHFANSEMVVIFVGANKIKFNVHQDVLTKHCPFFRGCLQSGMKESLTNEVILPEEDGETFSRFLDWVYTGKFKVIKSDGDFQDTFSLWLLADKWLMYGWQNSLMDRMLNHWDGEFMSPRYPIWAFETTGRTDVAVFELVKNVFLTGLKKSYRQNRNEYGRKSFETLIDKQIVSISELMDAVSGCWENPKKNLCDYHVHANGEKCPGQAIKF